MSIAFDTTQGNTPASGTTTTISVTTNSANEVIVFVTVCQPGTTSTVKDGGSNNFTKAFSRTLPVTGDEMTVWWIISATAQTQTVTATYSGTVIPVAIADTYSGVDLTTPLEVGTFTDFTAATGTLNGTVTTLTANALVISFAGCNVVPLTSMAAGTGFTDTSNKTSTNGVNRGIGVWGDFSNLATVSPGAVTCPWTETLHPFTGSIIGISLKPAAGATVSRNYAISY